MLQWFLTHWATVLVSTLLAVVIFLVVLFMIRNKKRGKSSCGCGCQSCPMSASCHKK